MIHPPRILASCSLLVFIGGLFAIFYIATFNKPKIDTQDFPSVGNINAPVHMVVFEEPLCAHCKAFNTDVYPKLYATYITTEQLYYTVIPLSFLPSSMPAALTWLCVYHQNPSVFFSYVDESYRSNANQHLDKLLSIAQQFDLNTSKLQKCVKTRVYWNEVERNNALAYRLMQGKVTAPAVYINGELVEDPSYDTISKKITTYTHAS